MSNKNNKREAKMLAKINKYRNITVKEIIQEVEQEFPNTREDAKKIYNEVKKRTRIKDNIEKVNNILDLKKLLNDRLDKLNNELGVYEIAKSSIDNMKGITSDIEKLKTSMEKSEQDLNKLYEEKNNLKAKLKTVKANTVEEQEIKDKINEVEGKIGKNNSEYKKLLENMQAKEGLKGHEEENQKGLAKKIQKLNDKEIEKEKVEISSKISKCNFAINRLMEGYTYDSVELALDKWEDRSFKGKDTPISKVSEKHREKDKNIDIESLSDKIIKNAEELTGGDSENKLVEVSEFEQKHPRLAKITNWVKNKWNKFRGKDSKQPEQQKEEEKQESSKDSHEDFKKYLREVAEKGLDTVKREEAQTKLEENKKKAYDREKAKFGKDYAEQSYHMQDDDEHEI